MIAATVKLNHPTEKNRWIDESPINIWLLANVGVHAKFQELVDDSYPWHQEHHLGYLLYHFAREQDAVLFALRWV